MITLVRQEVPDRWQHEDKTDFGTLWQLDLGKKMIEDLQINPTSPSRLRRMGTHQQVEERRIPAKITVKAFPNLCGNQAASRESNQGWSFRSLLVIMDRAYLVKQGFNEGLG